MIMRFSHHLPFEVLLAPTELGYEPRTEDGMFDVQRLQRAIWGRPGYTSEGRP